MELLTTDQFTNAGTEAGATILVAEFSDFKDSGIIGSAFDLKSTRTGRVIRFVRSRTVKAEGDLVLVDYVPADSEVDAPRVVVRIFND